MINLSIITPYSVFLEGQVDQVIVRTASGDRAVMHKTLDFVSVLPVGMIRVMIGDKYRYASTSGGMIKVTQDRTLILAKTCEWSDEIDIERALRAQQEAERRKENAKEEKDLLMAQAKLTRALNRINVANTQ